MALDRWQKQLCDILAAVHLKQQQFDLASAACQILLKPWPKKSQKSESVDEKDITDSNYNATDDQMHPHEKTELKMLNDVLRRAQKTRVKTASKKLKEKAVPVDDPVPSRSGRELWEQHDLEPESNQELHKGNAQSSKSKPMSVIKNNDSVKNVANAQSEQSTKNAARKQQPRLSGEQSSRSVSKCHLSVSSTKKPAGTGDQQQLKSLESRVSSGPPSRPRSARGNFKPAHAAAPFKTDPRLHLPKPCVKRSIRPVRQQHAGKCQNYADDRNNTNSVLFPVAMKKGHAPSLAFDIQEDDILEDACDTHSGPVSERPYEKVDDQISSGHEENLNSCLATLSVEPYPAQNVSVHQSGSGVDADAPFHEGSSSQPEEKQDTNLFSLLSDGSSINISGKMRRAFARNQQLRKKVSQQDKARKPKSAESDTAQKFAEKLELLFDPEEELLYRQKALACLHSHEQLLLLMTQLNLDNISEASSAKDILRAKVLSEFVLSSFSEVSEEVNFLSKVQFPDTPAVMQPSHREVRHPYLWLPASLQGENLTLAHKIQYTSKPELNQYMNVLLRLQTLQCQRYLLDILISGILPWLQQQDYKQKDFGAVFRGLSTLFTSDGSQLPVLICDSVQ